MAKRVVNIDHATVEKKTDTLNKITLIPKHERALRPSHAKNEGFHIAGIIISP